MLRHQRRHTSPVYPPCASCVGTFWRCVVSARRRRRKLGVIPVSFASPLSFILSVCTLLIFPTQKNSPSSITGWSLSLPSEEDEKSQQAVKPKSNSWVLNRGEHQSAVDSAQIKSGCQHEPEQEIAPLCREKKISRK